MRKWWLPAILAIIFVVLTTVFTKEFQKVNSTEPTAWTVDHRGDCAVVLTGGYGRVREGFDLLSQGRVRKLIVSGVFPGASLREIFPNWPFYGAISEEDVVLEKRSGTTYGNAQQSLPLVEALNCRSVVLITSRVHMYRAEKIFRAVFPNDIPIQTRALVSGAMHPPWSDLALETLKSLFYSLWAYY